METVDRIVKWVTIAAFVLYILAVIITLASCSPYLPTTPAAADNDKGTVILPSPTPAAGVPSRITPTPRPSCKVAGGTVYLRRDAGMNYPAIAVLHKGETLTVTATGEWMKVLTRDNQAGYIYSKYCKE